MSEELKTTNFIHDIIDADLASGKRTEVVTRFPPEPNGYLHIGHAKAICLDFGTAEKYNGKCHLRFDDTNPEAEDEEYVQAIQEDIKWLGFNWGENLFWASNYFDAMYEYAVRLINKGKAYVCELTQEEFKDYRGAPTEPGKEPPGRDRSIEENLELFEKMKNGGFKDGACVLRVKIDMTSPNLHLRDPAIYRIKTATHHNTGDKWCIYPMYDFAHCIEDSIEGVTHSMCTLEFEVHRPLYDWILRELDVFQPQQIEFSRLNLTYTVMSKRKLLELVNEKLVNGWDDPRMPTLCGMRRRGFSAESIRKLCDIVGCTKVESISEVELLESCVRDNLNENSLRAMAVVDPIKVVIENYPDELEEEFELPNHPQKEEKGKRTVPFSRELWIERTDYKDDAPNKFKGFTLGREVRLRGAYLATCNEVIKDADGEVTELRCTYDPETKGGSAPDGRKVKSTIHWVSAKHAVDTEVRLYDRLFTVENPLADKEADFKDFLNPESLQLITAKLEPGLAKAKPGTRFQFERVGYFCADKDSTEEAPVFNRTLTLRAPKKVM
ncbi:glutamine--tRNA ligase/YqeY domain fusion protein [Pontiella sulfatireligans]|uniref:Glutamine--tRNA ligase n=1 Tax=Pontiella sulfatireligans TaxID=2750658 RepID=A0A6C2UIH8_9BACT|nr:glutamine--tRNA ligase/YqeY domain fusion protein [Pontiella sulfatireligans]VGO20022.1 Glutamine--tRNA ligase [Pontiella sulfatireligans]